MVVAVVGERLPATETLLHFHPLPLPPAHQAMKICSYVMIIPYTIASQEKF